MYARVWQQVPDTNHGLYQTGKFKQGVAFADFKKYFNDTCGYKYYWDRKAKAPYQYNATEKLFATFDDKRSVRKKAQFVKRKKLGGIMFWELAQDIPTGGLIEIMYKMLK